MSESLTKYTDYKIKSVQEIKGKYGFRVILIFEDGRNVTQQIAGFSSRQEAEKCRKITEADLIQRTYLVYGNAKLKDYIWTWMDELKKNVTANTIYSYRYVINGHIIPVLGNKRMKEINSADVVRLYTGIFAKSECVAKQAKVIMKTFLDYAESNKAVKVNVAADLRLPKGTKKVPYHARKINADKTLNHDQIMSLIDASKGTSLHMMILFNVVMGLRCSEIIGVKYSDVDFIKRELTVSRQLGVDLSKDKTQLPAKTYTKQEIEPKTKSSYRTIKIPDLVFEAILEEKKLYNARKNRRKREFQDLGYICCSTYGRPRCKNYHYKAFKRLLKELGLPDIRWHDLRSTAITQILVSGINPKAAAKFAGHSKEIVTVDVYTDNRKLSVMKLDRLEEFIASVIPKEECQKMNLSEYRINVEDYLPS